MKPLRPEIPVKDSGLNIALQHEPDSASGHIQGRDRIPVMSTMQPGRAAAAEARPASRAGAA
jgi:hypothetical protein